MKGTVYFGFFTLVFLWGCGGTPFLIGDFKAQYKPKLKTVAVMPFLLPAGNREAEESRTLLEEKIAHAITREDSAPSYLFPSDVRSRLGGASDSAILLLAAEGGGRLFSAEALLFGRVIRLHQSTGDNPTSRQTGGARYQRRGVELMMEFRLVEAASNKLLWRYRIRRFGKDVEEAARFAAQAFTHAWPL